MGKRRALVWAMLGVLILVGTVILGSNVSHHFGWSTACVATGKRSVHSPHDSSTVTIAAATCGETRNEIRVRLASAGKVYQLFSASSKTSDTSIEIVWRSAKHVELHYSRAVQVEFPPQIDEVKHFFGGVEVTYSAM